MSRPAPAGPERDRWSRVYMFVAALEACTGKRLGDDPDAWRRAVRGP
ncbi:MAG: hypothetical protein O7E54_03440 [Planctomycetota bacterium]|nr:hypothetical protein [Planctomycetota bacterium]